MRQQGNGPRIRSHSLVPRLPYNQIGPGNKARGPVPNKEDGITG